MYITSCTTFSQLFWKCPIFRLNSHETLNWMQCKHTKGNFWSTLYLKLHNKFRHMAVTEQFLRNCRRILNNKHFSPPHDPTKWFYGSTWKKNLGKKHEIGGMDRRVLVELLKIWPTHNVEIREFLCHLDFTWNQCWWIWEFKNCHFGALNILFW